ncbi:Fibronectin type III domain [Actinomyces bovis]|uniref:Fibronectin type III domain n=1 Tax=Actinomyces bovis TaxID=1658 RepID=A0ABY1VN60_9ACTO|nr:fibronectin type III domain-containing protein [Actinomyces bovis]SPT53121.1 Fibronectin type III domain [Actinomyces bovis]VEG52262.1 Fibronectin type III domain [Actinomyces israelii]
MPSNPFARISNRARRRVSALTATAVTLAFAGAAWAYPGVSQTDLELNDGGVWVTSAAQHLVGRVNYPSRQIDSSVRTASSHFDVTQVASEVLVHDADAASVASVDPALVEFTSPTNLSPTAKVAQGGNRVIAYDPEEGTVRGTRTSELGALPSMRPLLEKLPNVAATIGQDGSVYAVSSSGELATVAVASQGWKEPKRQQLELPAGGDLAITVVGDQPVVLETGTGVLHLPGGAKTELGSGGFVLQQPGPASSTVLVASRTGLLTVPLEGGAPSDVVPQDQLSGAQGVAAQPVLLRGCTYGAWSSSGQFIRQCAGEAPEVKTDSNLASAQNPVFRVNRDAIVLNDTIKGNVWLPEDNLVLVDKWVDATAQADDNADRQDKSAKTTQSKKTKPDRTQENHAPTAYDDNFGVRPGRSTVLNVLANDVDTDGDILTATSGYTGNLGTVTAGQSGRTLQINVPANATGSTAIPYTASDGRGQADSAVATVTVHDWNVNSAPTPGKEQQSLSMAQGGTISAYVLGDWQDPDGDPVFLASASGTDVEVQTTQEGTITVRDTGAGPGTRRIELLVSDGRETTAGTVFVEVIPTDQVSPIVNADHVRVVAGSTITVSPLANDISPTGEPLKLAQLQEAPAGTKIDLDRRAGTFTFSSDVPQTYYLDYGAIGGAALATSVIRIDVVEKSDPSVPPVVENDTALLRNGGSVTVAPLANDFDPAGGVLVLQDISLPATPGITATVVDHAYLQVNSTDQVPDNLTITYNVSNGTSTATGTVAVVRAAQDDTQPPVAQGDTAIVGAGDIITIPVLKNDYSPSRLPIKLASEVNTVGESLGTAWISDKTLRFKAGATPGPTTLTYTVTDDHGQRATGTVNLEVRATTAETNAPPHAESIEAQTVAGQELRIPVTLDGIDPDGDSVTLKGLDQTPKLGAAQVESTWITYTPAASVTGTDTFTYTVEDRYGAKATGTVRVGIAPAATTNSAPVAVDDVVTAKPGRTIAVDVISNDIDGDGDALTLAEDPVSDDPALKVGVRAGRVVVTLPDQEGVHTLRYTVTDSRGGSDTGTVTFQALNAAPLLAPIGVDDYAQVDKAEANGTIMVPVLDNDRDDDGSPWALSVSTNDPTAAVVGTDVRVTMQDQPHLVLYTITDQDGLSGNAVIQVPGKSSTPPRIDPATVPVHITQDQPSDVQLAGHVITRSGTSPTLVEGTSPRVTPGLSSATAQDGNTALHLVPEAGFSGTTSVTFEVTDGAAANPLHSTLTIPVVVDSSTNTPPVFTPTQVTVTAGGPSVSADLAAMTRDNDAGDLAAMTYTIGAAPTGFTVSQAGSQVTISSPQGTANDTQGTLSVTVSDGKSNPVTGSLPLRAVTEEDNQPLPTALSTSLESNGRPVSVDVSSLVSTTLPNPQIALVGSPAVTSGQGSASASGNSVTISPDAGFHGRIVVSFRVTDDPQKPNRTASGTIVVAVTGVPSAPTGVQASANSSSSALVSWAAAGDNGSAVTGYTVTEVGGAGSWNCNSSPCLASGLRAGGSYSFRVVAHSAAGDSAPSAPSAAINLTLRPQTPAAPSLVGGNGTLTVSWTAVPAIPGGVTYQVTLSPEVTGANPVSVPTASTSATFSSDQIKVGVPYHATVMAIPNDPNGQKSAVSASSASATAYSAPGKPGTPYGAFNSNDQIDLQWAAAAPNGSPVTYSVAVSGPGGPATYDTSSRTSLRVNASDRGTYTFTVTATNAAGSVSSEPWSVAHSTVPMAPTVPALNSNQVSGQLQLATASTPVSGKGWSAAELSIEYEMAQVGATGNPWPVPAGGGVFTGLTNGRSYVLRARAVGVDGTRSQPSSWSSPAIPVTTPRKGQVSCSTQDRSIVCTWSADTDTGLPTTYSVTANGEAISSNATGSTKKEFLKESGSLEVCVRTANQLGTNQSCGIGQIAAPPPQNDTPWAKCTLDGNTATCKWDVTWPHTHGVVYEVLDYDTGVQIASTPTGTLQRTLTRQHPTFGICAIRSVPYGRPCSYVRLP